MCAGSALAGSIVTVVVQSNSECNAVAEQQRQQHDADASFEARPNNSRRREGVLAMDRRLLLFLTLAGVFVGGDAVAATDLSHADTSIQGLLGLVLQQSHQWSGKLYGYAIRLFWLLASIQFIWTFMPLVMKQSRFRRDRRRAASLRASDRFFPCGHEVLGGMVDGYCR